MSGKQDGTASAQMGRPVGRHAVVIGGSIGGMMTARVLSDFFAQVTVIERDPVTDAPEPRKGQPQARHLHGLLAHGRQTMEAFYPGMTDEVVEHGALSGDMGERIYWYVNGGWRKRFTTGVSGVSMSRPLLEWVIRRRTLALPNVRLLDETAVQEPLWSADRHRVTGVRIYRRDEERAEELTAELVVDVSGRGSHAPKWLEEAGYGRPTESVVKVDVTYGTRVFERWEGNPLGDGLLMIAADAEHPRTGFLFPIEEGRWMVALGGRGGETPPADEQGYLAFAQSLAAPDLYNLLRRAKPLSGFTPHRFPSNLRRHYEKMQRFPSGFLVVGDAVCSFNPVYGQGMTSAALQVRELQRLLGERRSVEGLAQPVYAAIDKVLASPWQLTVGEDYRFADTVGKKPPMTDLINRYVDRVNIASQCDTVVYGAFLKVMNLMAPPTSLFAPRIMRRVLLGKPAVRAEPSPLAMPATGAAAD